MYQYIENINGQPPSVGNDGALCEVSWANDSNQFGQLLNKIEGEDEDFLDIDYQDERSFSAIHYTCSNGNLEMTEALLNKGCRSDIMDKEGNTPLLFVASQPASNEHFQLLMSLIEFGADPNVQNFNGETPLHLAALNGNNSMVAFLIENGANVNAKNVEGSSPLHMAISAGHLEVVSYLATHGAFMNAQDDEGDSPLHYAVREGILEMIQLLIKSGADVDMANEDQESSLDLAKELGEEQIFNLLGQFSKLNGQNLRLKPTVASNFVDIVSFGKPSLENPEKRKANINSCMEDFGQFSTKNEGRALSSFETGYAWVPVQH